MASENDTNNVTVDRCKKSRKCSKSAKHKGRCNAEGSVNPFWESSSSYKLNKRKRKLLEEVHCFQQHIEAKKCQLAEHENRLINSEEQAQNILNEKGNYNYRINQFWTLFLQVQHE